MDLYRHGDFYLRARRAGGLFANGIERRCQATGSAKAAELLADLPNALQHFVKVVPTEYRRALADLESVAVAAE